MSGREYARWKRLYRRQPFGVVRGDMQAGMVARAVIAVNGGKRNLPKLAEFVIVSKAVKGDEGRVTKEQLQAIALAAGVPFTDGRADTDR